jgi:hypothetical protein
MQRIWLALGALTLLMLGITVVGVVVIMATWPTFSEEEQFQPIHAVAFFPDSCRFATMAVIAVIITGRTRFKEP